MSAELKDFRGKITVEADCVIEAESRSTGRDKAEIVRDSLHEEAMRRIHAARLLDSMLRAQGEPGIGEGISGNLRDSRGTPVNRGAKGKATA
jgi:hypothetical protein